MPGRVGARGPDLSVELRGTYNRVMNYPNAFLTAVVLQLAALMAPARDDPKPQSESKRLETLSRPEGGPLHGRLVTDAGSEIRFLSDSDGKPLPLSRGFVVEFPASGPESPSGPRPFQVLLGGGQRISGRLAEINRNEIRLDDGPGRRPLTVARGGAVAVIQRPGEAQVLLDSFDALDSGRWSETGDAVIDNDIKSSGGKHLKLPASGASVTSKLAEPVSAGRFELSYYDAGDTASGCRQWVELSFRTRSNDLASVRAVLGWSDETLAVESPQGPGLAVQPLTRKRGWHRLTVRFGPDRLDLQVDDDELAHGNGPPGPLAEIRLATEVGRKATPPATLFARFDDLQLARIATPSGRQESDPSQDEIRIVTGDQVFGTITKADARGVALEQDGKVVSLPWSEVSGVYFRRSAHAGEWIEGVLVRVDWRTTTSSGSQEHDTLEGTLNKVTDAELSIATPYAGTVILPRDRLSRLEVLGNTRRMVLDATAHHLGDRVVSDLDPPQPEGGTYELSFELKQVPETPARLVVDVVQVVGESGDEYSAHVKNGELLTRVSMNGKPFDTLNKHITTKNEIPERIHLAIPAGVLKAGPNVLRFQQEGTKEDPSKRDNLGLLGIALEFDGARPVGTRRP
jgi:hypothetical protein